MVQSQKSDDLTPPEPSLDPENLPEAAQTSDSTRNPAVRWIAVVSILLLAGGLGFGWRWWSSSQAQTAVGPGGGQMPGLPVKLETAQLSTVENSTEFIGSLESQQAITVRPEVTGRVSRIFVEAGDRVTAGTGLVQLQPDQQEANLASVIASINSARAIRSNAQSQIQALEAELVAQQAEVQLQEENYRRIAELVNEGAFAKQRLDEVVRDRQTAQANLSALNRRIQAARASFQEAEAGLQQAQANANRATAQLQDTTVVAPFSGVVGDMPVRLGDVVTPSDTLTTLTQSSALDLRLSIPLESAPDLRLGQTIELTDPQGKTLRRGTISFIAPRVNTNAQSILAKATFNNSDNQLRDGQFVRARVIWEKQPGVLIPTTAIARLAGEPFIFVAEAPQPQASPSPASPAANSAPAPSLVARQRQVTLGTIQDNRYHVLSGIKPGEQVVVSGILNLADGTPIMPESAMLQTAPNSAPITK